MGFKSLFLCCASLSFSLPQTIDYSKLRPCCDAESEFWVTGQYAFNSAPEVGSFLTYLKALYQIDIAVETGTFKGNTTAYLALLFSEVYTIEVLGSTYQSSSNKLKIFPNVQCLLGSSDVVLKDLLPRLKGRPVLFYLDAHWNEWWPLREEIREIGKTHRDNCVIVIDDIKVPKRPDIVFDVHYVIPAKLNSRAKLVILPRR
jgi:hypothetical protein